MLTKLTRFSFSSITHTICIVAGGPHQDLNGAQLISTIKKVNPNINFIGIGGPLMQQAGLDKSYADVSKFCNKPLYPYKNFLHFHIEQSYHLVFGWYHFKNRKVRNEIDKSTFFKDIASIKPSAFITLSNDFFMSRLFWHITDMYKTLGQLKPPCFHYDLTHSNQRHEYLDFLDYYFSIIPRPAVNYQYFTFPNTIVGHEGIGRAWQYIYSKNPQFKNLQDESGIYLCPEFNRQIVEQLVLEERARFRKNHDITDQQVVLFLGAGDVESEIKFTINRFKDGLVEFFKLDQLRQVNKDNFVIVLSVPEGPAHSLIERQSAQLNNLGCKVILVKDKYSAISGSDFGACHNGQIVSECAALQLPVIILDSMPFLQAYMTQMYNDYNNPLNIATKGETQPEMLSVSATPYRISEDLFKYYQDPKYRYYLAEKFAPVLYDMIPTAFQTKGNEIVKENKVFKRHMFTNQYMANKIIEFADNYKNTPVSLKGYELQDYRENWIKGLQLR